MKLLLKADQLNMILDQQREMNALTITKCDGVPNAVRINPPANILTIEVINDVNAFVEQLANDDDTRVVVFRPSPRNGVSTYEADKWKRN